MNRTRASRSHLGKARMQHKFGTDQRHYQQFLIDDYLEDQCSTHEVPIVVRRGENDPMGKESQEQLSSSVPEAIASSPVRTAEARTEFRPIDIPRAPKESFSMSGVFRGFLYGFIPGAILLLLIAYLY